MQEKYTTFQTEDFILDPYFREWVLSPDAGSNAFWPAFLQQYPGKKPMLEEARLVLLSLRVKEEEISDEQLSHSLRHLQQRMEQTDQRTIPLNNRTAPRRWVQWYRVAAAVVLLMMAGGVWWKVLRRSARTEYQTAFGEVRTIKLPDQSTVTLNANSRLLVPDDWHTGPFREVWLEGEAFFHVEKKSGSAQAKFIVHTDDLNVEVLGTSFTVKEREYGARVVLNTGKVKLSLAGEPQAESIFMQPGDLVEFSREQNRLTRKAVHPEKYSSWKNRRIILDNTSMAEVARVIEETYGVTVQFEDPGLASTVLNGTSLPTDNAEALLRALSTTLGVAVERNGDTIIFRK